MIKLLDKNDRKLQMKMIYRIKRQTNNRNIKQRNKNIVMYYIM